MLCERLVKKSTQYFRGTKFDINSIELRNIIFSNTLETLRALVDII